MSSFASFIGDTLKENTALIQKITLELEAARKELAKLKEENAAMKAELEETTAMLHEEIAGEDW